MTLVSSISKLHHDSTLSGLGHLGSYPNCYDVGLELLQERTIGAVGFGVFGEFLLPLLLCPRCPGGGGGRRRC
jgi:hypothetical protein